jgi:hypothetical protein
MKCPHCTEGFHEEWATLADAGTDPDGRWLIFSTTCPECKRVVLRFRRDLPEGGFEYTLIRPRAPARAPLSADVPDPFAGDYKEACLVLADSPKASAALSRRCLQHLLREKANVKHGNLYDEIEEAMPSLPPHLAGNIDAVRTIGNFAAHTQKSTNTGEIIDVEPGEADWCLDVLEGLFDFYFVQPAMSQRRWEALNQKLQDAGKSPVNQPSP